MLHNFVKTLLLQLSLLDMSYQLYRNTSLGQTLQDSLYELMQYGQIPPSLATEVLLQYDKAINEALNSRVKNRVWFHSGKLSTYRFCDNVWTFLLKDVEFKENTQMFLNVGKVKIVACDAKASHGGAEGGSAPAPSTSSKKQSSSSASAK
ncbi:transcription initiation factor IIA subunit 2-like [Tigriopus californicus]|uniref:transcription initiation factor IIA subunit 2-like n=1 Tax=Tigriopus californicus TaxID=6832 RepID=UPI0027DA86FB|nr:transcription initiation factor IIA subunit 2-like [Tigriopus californicus]